jgi:hypothetical protein
MTRLSYQRENRVERDLLAHSNDMMMSQPVAPLSSENCKHRARCEVEIKSWLAMEHEVARTTTKGAMGRSSPPFSTSNITDNLHRAPLVTFAGRASTDAKAYGNAKRHQLMRRIWIRLRAGKCFGGTCVKMNESDRQCKINVCALSKFFRELRVIADITMDSGHH